MSDTLQCVFSIIRYVPDVIRGEYVNIGVILQQVLADSDPPIPVRTFVEVTRDWSRVLGVDAGADVRLLESLEADIAADMGIALQQSRIYGLSHFVQITAPRACLADDLQAELIRLMRVYVDSKTQYKK